MSNSTPQTPSPFQAAKSKMLERQAREAAVRLHHSQVAAIALEHPVVVRYMGKANEAYQKIVLSALAIFAGKSDVDKPFKHLVSLSLRGVKDPGLKRLLSMALEDGGRMATDFSS